MHAVGERLRRRVPHALGRERAKTLQPGDGRMAFLRRGVIEQNLPDKERKRLSRRLRHRAMESFQPADEPLEASQL
jgi:hypothetical protein